MRSRSFWGVIRVPCTQVVRVPHDWRPAGWHMHTCACSPSLREDVVRRLPSASQEEGLHQSPPMLAPSSQTAQPPELWEICLLFKPCRRWHFVITAWADWTGCLLHLTTCGRGDSLTVSLLESGWQRAWKAGAKGAGGRGWRDGTLITVAKEPWDLQELNARPWSLTWGGSLKVHVIWSYAYSASLTGRLGPVGWMVASVMWVELIQILSGRDPAVSCVMVQPCLSPLWWHWALYLHDVATR